MPKKVILTKVLILLRLRVKKVVVKGGLKTRNEGLDGWPDLNFLSKIFFLFLIFDSEGLFKKGRPPVLVYRHTRILAGLLETFQFAIR